MTAGRVAVNGVVATELGTRVDPATDTVTVDGRLITLGTESAYLVLNKPTGYVTTMSDPHGRPTVAELVPVEALPGLFPVGRLDLDTTGLLLFTTDGELGHGLLHPRYHVAKTYRATVEGSPTEESLEQLREGVTLDDGPTAPAEVTPVHRGRTSEVEITIREGRKRQVRRMFAAVGHSVVSLHRIKFGPLELGDLAPGETRHLTLDEVEALRSSVRGG